MLWVLYKYLIYILNKFVDAKLFEYSWNQMITLKLKTYRAWQSCLSLLANFVLCRNK